MRLAPSLRSGLRPWVALALVVAVSALAWAQRTTADQPVGNKPPARAKLEYLHQDVQPEAIVQTLNDLDAQGWEVFQIIPNWQFKNDNGEASLSPRSYAVFGRRAKTAD